MQMQQIRHVLALVEHRSLAQAAKSLGISQPALSKSLRRLETYLGVKLFERTPRGVLATEFGREFGQRARAIAVEIDEAERSIGAIRDGREGRISVGSAPSVIASILPIATARLLKRHDDLKLNVIGGLHDRLFEWLRVGEIDIAISNIVTQSTDSDLTQELLFVDRVVVACRPGHPLLDHPNPSGAELARYHWILPATTVMTRQHLEIALASLGLDAPKLAIETNSLVFMRAMILETDCLGYLPADAMAPGRECADVVPARIDWLNWDRPVGITLRRSGILSPACRRLIAELRKVCGELYPDQAQTAPRMGPQG